MMALIPDPARSFRVNGRTSKTVLPHYSMKAPLRIFPILLVLATPAFAQEKTTPQDTSSPAKLIAPEDTSLEGAELPVDPFASGSFAQARPKAFQSPD